MNGFVTAIATGIPGNADVLYVGTNIVNQIYGRTAPGTVTAATMTGYTSGAIRDLVIDTNNALGLFAAGTNGSTLNEQRLFIHGRRKQLPGHHRQSRGQRVADPRIRTAHDTYNLDVRYFAGWRK